MKTLIAIAFMFPLLASAQEWTSKDTALELTYLVFHVADWSQTKYIVSHPENHRESNIILGERPSNAEINRYFILTGMLHVGIAYALPDKWRQAFQIFTIGFEAGVVARNYNLGVRLEF